VVASFWGTFFQLPFSPFNWIDRVMEDMGMKVGRMLNAATSRSRSLEGQVEKKLPSTGLPNSAGGG
jgi:hypothetical protein